MLACWCYHSSQNISVCAQLQRAASMAVDSCLMQCCLQFEHQLTQTDKHTCVFTYGQLNWQFSCISLDREEHQSSRRTENKWVQLSCSDCRFFHEFRVNTRSCVVAGVPLLPQPRRQNQWWQQQLGVTNSDMPRCDHTTETNIYMIYKVTLILFY